LTSFGSGLSAVFIVCSSSGDMRANTVLGLAQPESNSDILHHVSKPVK